MCLECKQKFTNFLRIFVCEKSRQVLYSLNVNKVSRIFLVFFFCEKSCQNERSSVFLECKQSFTIFLLFFFCEISCQIERSFAKSKQSFKNFSVIFCEKSRQTETSSV